MIKFCLFILFSALCHLAWSDEYTQKIQPLFNNRCLSCHSCSNAPCQLNLQNYEGFTRGANKLNVYDGLRIHSVQPTRLWIDANSIPGWRKKQFFDLNTSKDPAKNIFFQMIAMKDPEITEPPPHSVAESMNCPATLSQQKEFANEYPELGMPFGLPALNASEVSSIKEWIGHGAPGPDKIAQEKIAFVPEASKKQIREWENFLNKPTPQQRLVSRYLYEHLFLAHIYFKDSGRDLVKEAPDFFRLVRSRNACGNKIDEIATVRPNGDPGVKKFFYCLKKFPGTIVEKTHMPLEFSPAKLDRLQEIFYRSKWPVKRFPSYETTVAENPFIAFQDIPVRARYEFLIEDALYQIGTFIKGPVCNGSNAVNSIQEQFYVFFLDPNSDNAVISPKYADKAKNLLILPGVWGSEIPALDTLPLLKKLTDYREAYRQLRSAEMRKVRPTGYDLKDIWNGDGKNPNAVLTVFRHYDNAVVLRGAVGDLSKTAFVLDYPLFERLVYNLVVNFDVYGNVGHQSLTRIYMDMTRMEAEELFLNFLPPQKRTELRKDWYRGLLTDIKMKFIFPEMDLDYPTAVKYDRPSEAKEEFTRRILFERMNEKVRGPLDALNWKTFRLPRSIVMPKLDPSISEFKKITSIKAEEKSPFAQYMPDIAYILVQKEDHTQKVLTVIHNREHENISWILGESLRMLPKEDTLTITEGFSGAYPNMFFVIPEALVKNFVNEISTLQSSEDYQKLVSKHGVSRMKSHFWEVYDSLNRIYREQEPIQFGYLDLTRYAL